MSEHNLLIVEDDDNLGKILTEYLQLKGYGTTLCKNGEEGLEKFKTEKFDFCILDIMMPKKDGFTLAREIRAMDQNIPLLFLTAKSMKSDTVEGLKIGADDYITKPFSMEELLLRVKAILKRTESAHYSKKEYNFGQFYYQYDNRTITTPSKTVKLTSKENELLYLLCQNFNKTVDRSLALKKIWLDDSYFNARSMDVYIAKLRKILKEDDNIQILTIHGHGFKLVKVS
ncbi:MAG TPA: response regulator transcription factor [Cyclobacteriaceae bacterium]